MEIGVIKNIYNKKIKNFINKDLNGHSDFEYKNPNIR